MPQTISSQIQFRMPAEWEPHAATWLAWPHYKLDWPGKFEPIPWVYAEIIRYLSRHERVELIVKDGTAEKVARKTLKRAHALNESVRFHRWPTNRVWTRDSGCAFAWPTSGAKAPISKEGSIAGQEALRHPKPNARAGTPVPPQSKRNNGGTGVPARAQQISAIKWRFNAWPKYPNCQHEE